MIIYKKKRRKERKKRKEKYNKIIFKWKCEMMGKEKEKFPINQNPGFCNELKMLSTRQYIINWQGWRIVYIGCKPQSKHPLVTLLPAFYYLPSTPLTHSADRGDGVVRFSLPGNLHDFVSSHESNHYNEGVWRPRSRTARVLRAGFLWTTSVFQGAEGNVPPSFLT